ncbi:MAG TPA: nitroreductase family protein [Candidatus Dormibacteraeota bacterium]|nr:nitroreductase family protein [Candidatus Dormibacteraeota bacterium]
MSEIGLYEAMASTRAVRRLRPDPIPDAVLRRVLEAATWAPSGGNRQPWRVIAVRDPAIKRTLGELYAGPWTPYASRQRAQLARLPEASRSRGERALAAGDFLAAHLHEVPVIAVFCFQPELLMITDAALPRPSVVGGASLYPAVQNLLLACRAEGLGCVLTTLLCVAEAQIRPLLQIPEPWATAAFVPIGYPVGRGHSRVSRKPVEEMTFADRWDTPLF